MRQEVGGSVAGVTFVFRTDLPDLEEYARRHLAPVIAPAAAEPRIEASLTWHESAPPSERDAHDFRPREMERWDRDLYVGAGSLCWFRIDACRDLHLRAEWDGSRLRLRGDYYFYLSRDRRRDRVKRWLSGARIRRMRARRFTTLLYYLVYYPAFWYAETLQDRHPIHAAGVVTDRGAIVLAGPSGVGKSTLSMALAATGGFLSETFLLHQGTRVWPVREPILLDSRSVAWLGDAMSTLRQLGRTFVFAREGYHRFEGLADEGDAVLVILPRRAPETYVRALGAEEAHHRISASGQIIRDQRRYGAFAAAFESLALRGLISRREEALRKLTAGARCVELGLGPDLERDEVVRTVMQLMESPPAIWPRRVNQS